MKMLSIYRQWTVQRALRKLIRNRDISSLLSQLRKAHENGQLDTDKASVLVCEAMAMTGVRGREDQWRTFFDSMPAGVQPASFEVHHLMGRIDAASDAAKTQDEKRAVTKLCESAQDYPSIEIGLKLAGQLEDSDALRRFHEQAGDALSRNQPEVAVKHYIKSKSADKLSYCLESLGRLWDALHHATYENTERLLHLMEACFVEVEAANDDGKHLEALDYIHTLRTKARSAPDPTDFLKMIERLDTDRTKLVDTARTAYHEQVQAACTDGERKDIYSRWSQFEELAGDLPHAAELAIAAHDIERAIDLYDSAELYASAIKLANSEDQLWIAARIYEKAGDFAGAAEAYRKVDRLDDAVRCYERAGMPGKAADLLAAKVSQDERANNAHYIDLMKAAGRRSQLVDLILRNAASLKLGSPGFQFIETELLEGNLAGLTLEQARQAAQKLYGNLQEKFDARADHWLTDARASVDGRYSKIWGLDLGTTNSAAMVYNKEQRRPEACVWKNKRVFPSTLTLDNQGVEVVGLTQEEVLNGKFLGIVSSSKRRMGKNQKYEIGGRTYRPEYVGAKIMSHARTVVERYLGEQVAKVIRVRAEEELGHFRQAWLEKKFGPEFRPLGTCQRH